MPDHIYYTNDDMKNDLLSIARQMHMESFTPEIVVGLARGGLAPALMMSHYFDAALVTLNVSLRDNKVDHGHDSLDTLRADIALGKSILIVDDICDSGHTMKVVWESIGSPERNSSVRSAVLWNNPGQDVFDPTYFGREINRLDDERWIIFPFEDWWRR